MQIKRFEAKDMSEALSLIKQEFGPDAVILSARTLKKNGGMFGYMKKPIVEVTAAMDTYYEKENIRTSDLRTGFSHNHKSIRSSHNGTRNNMGLFIQSHGKPYSLNFNDMPPIKSRFENQTDSTGFGKLKHLMLQHGIEKDLAIDWLKSLERLLVANKPSNPVTLKKGLIQALTEISKSIGPPIKNRKKRNIIAFVGTTGVGKTTTIAKLAAIHALKMQQKVGLVTLDNYRIAAIDQIKAYAKIIGIPMESATNKKELIRSLKMLRNRNVILIDTPGISQMNKNRINDLKSIFNGVSNIQIQLLMNVSTNNVIVEDILQNFKTLPVTGLIFTKLDESTTFGNIVNQLCRNNIPISYFTNGQEVPEDIEFASIDKIVNLIIGESKEKSAFSIPPGDSEQEEDRPNKRIKTFYVANRNSDVFHKPNCKSAKKIKPSSMIVFEGEADAISNGFKPCRLCNHYSIEEYESVHAAARKRKIAIN